MARRTSSAFSFVKQSGGLIFITLCSMPSFISRIRWFSITLCVCVCVCVCADV